MIWGLKLTTLSTAWPKTLRLNHQCKSVASHHGAGTFLRDGKGNILPSMTMFVGVGLNMVDDYPDVWQCWQCCLYDPMFRQTHSEPICALIHIETIVPSASTQPGVSRSPDPVSSRCHQKPLRFKSNQNVLAHTIPNAAEVYNSHPGMITDDNWW